MRFYICIEPKNERRHHRLVHIMPVWWFRGAIPSLGVEGLELKSWRSSQTHSPCAVFIIGLLARHRYDYCFECRRCWVQIPDKPMKRKVWWTFKAGLVKSLLILLQRLHKLLPAAGSQTSSLFESWLVCLLWWGGGQWQQDTNVPVGFEYIYLEIQILDEPGTKLHGSRLSKVFVKQ